MKSSLFPSNLSADNIYNLKFTFENSENVRYLIHRAFLYLPDLQKDRLIKIVEQELGEPSWFSKPSKDITFSFKVDKNILSPHIFRIRLICSKGVNPLFRSPEFHMDWGPQIFLINPQPIFRAFISRSVRENENKIPNYISQLIKRWGFDTFTVGIEPLKKQYTEEELLQTINSEIEKADIVFAIATKRDRLLNILRSKTFEWLQSETAIAFSRKKKILLFVEKGVDISGLASKRVVLEFKSCKLKEIDRFFEKKMFHIRDNIVNKRNTEFLYNSLIGAGIIGGLILIGAGGYYLGKSSAKK